MENIKDYYKYAYFCSVCNSEYGSDFVETGMFLCPLHDKRFAEKHKRELNRLKFFTT
jgi:hypothetical protein